MDLAMPLGSVEFQSRRLPHLRLRNHLVDLLFILQFRLSPLADRLLWSLYYRRRNFK